jgi:pimeloyl-ACP methyl ester carboxylesterase
MSEREFETQQKTIDGLAIRLLATGDGPPLVIFHGAGTVTGFDFALSWAESYRILAPYHPGFGPSEDAPGLRSIDDYVAYYARFFDALDLNAVRLVGLSMGGWLAAKLTVALNAQTRSRITRLVLAAPAGLDVADHPMVNILAIPPEALFGHLAADPAVVAQHVPAEPDGAFFAERAKETASFARITANGERLTDPTLPAALSRLDVPTLLLWGEEDRVVPIGQAEIWARSIRDSQLRRYPNIGHLVFDETRQAIRDAAEFFAG